MSASGFRKSADTSLINRVVAYRDPYRESELIGLHSCSLSRIDYLFRRSKLLGFDLSVDFAGR